jgi:hypothetical protein
MNEFLRELLKSSIKDTKVRLLWLGIVPLLLALIVFPEKMCPPWLLEILKNTLTIRILTLICALATGFAVSFLLLYLKTKRKINIKDFKIHPDGYYTNPNYDFEICPKCLHKERPIVAPMTRASGPWQCVACGNKIDVKPASVSSEPIEERTRCYLTHKK